MKQSMLSLSTAHVSLQTAEWLDNRSDIEHYAEDSVVVFPKSEYGFFVAVHDDEDNLQNIPEDLLELLTFAKKEGFDWIMLDRDYDIVHGLPVFDW